MKAGPGRAAVALLLCLFQPALDVVLTSLLLGSSSEACCHRACCCSARAKTKAAEPCHGSLDGAVADACQLRCGHIGALAVLAARPPAILPQLDTPAPAQAIVVPDAVAPRPSSGFRLAVRRPPRTSPRPANV